MKGLLGLGRGGVGGAGGGVWGGMNAVARMGGGWVDERVGERVGASHVQPLCWGIRIWHLPTYLSTYLPTYLPPVLPTYLIERE